MRRAPTRTRRQALPCALLSLAACLAAAQVQAQGSLEFNVPQIGSGSPAYRFDPELAVFEPAADHLGPLLAEGARPVGRHELYVGAVYTRADIKNNGGQAIGSANDDFSKVTIDFIDLIAEFGLTERWEVTADLQLVNLVVDIKNSNVGDVDKFGVGDLRMRSKYHLIEAKGYRPDFALQGEIRFPTAGSGNDGLQDLGTGQYHFTIMGIVSGTYLNDWITPHVNVDIELTTEQDAFQDQGFALGERELWNSKWVIGTDVHPHDKVNVSIDFLGRHKLDSAVGFGENIYDAGIGLKLNPFSRFTVFAVAVLPLNKDEGFRPDVIWRAGAEMTFF